MNRQMSRTERRTRIEDSLLESFRPFVEAAYIEQGTALELKALEPAWHLSSARFSDRSIRIFAATIRQPSPI